MTAARTVDAIIDAVERAAELPDGALREMHRRTHDVSLARHVACYIGRRETRLSLKKIARSFGSDDHKLTLHGFGKASSGLAQNDPAVVKLIRAVAPELLSR